MLIEIVYQKRGEKRSAREKEKKSNQRRKERSYFPPLFYLARIYVDGIKINWPLTPRHCDTLEEKERDTERERKKVREGLGGNGKER